MKKQLQHWSELIHICQQADKVGLLSPLLELLLTPEEQTQMSLRVALIKALLKNELTQRTIAEQLKISIAKITRGSNALKSIDPTLAEFLKTELS